MKKTIKLCDGWKVFHKHELVLETENYQEVRKLLGMTTDEYKELWTEVTITLFCFGEASLMCRDGSIVRVEVIPCRD